MVVYYQYYRPSVSNIYNNFLRIVASHQRFPAEQKAKVLQSAV